MRHIDNPHRLAVWSSLSLTLAASLACGGGSSSPSGPNTIYGSGVMATESRQVQGFTNVSLTGVGRLDAAITGTESLTVRAEDNLLRYLVSEVRGDTLHLGPVSRPSLQGTREIRWDLTAIELQSVTLSNATQANVSNLSNQLFRLSADGAWNATAAGSTYLQELTLSGAGNYSAPNLESRVTIVDISGTVNAVIRVTGRLVGEITGPCQLEYYGDPQVELSITGTAKVRRMGS